MTVEYASPCAPGSMDRAEEKPRTTFDREILIGHLGNNAVVFSEIVYAIDRIDPEDLEKLRDDPEAIGPYGLGRLASTIKTKMKGGKEEAVDPLSSLGPRQHEALTLIGVGKTRQEIAEELEVSVKAVDIHVWRAYKKLGIHSKNQLAILMPFDESAYSYLSLADLDELTDRQVEVFGFIACGWQDPAIAGVLGINEKTVSDPHAKGIYKRLELSDRIDAVRAGQVFKDMVEREIIALVHEKAKPPRKARKDAWPKDVKPLQERYYELLEKLLSRRDSSDRIDSQDIATNLRRELGWVSVVVWDTLKKLRGHGCLSVEYAQGKSSRISAFVLHPETIARKINQGRLPRLPPAIFPEQFELDDEEKKKSDEEEKKRIDQETASEHREIDASRVLVFRAKTGKKTYETSYTRKEFAGLDTFHKFLLALSKAFSFNADAPSIDQNAAYLLRMVNRGVSQDKLSTEQEVIGMVETAVSSGLLTGKEGSWELTEETYTYFDAIRKSGMSREFKQFV